MEGCRVQTAEGDGVDPPYVRPIAPARGLVEPVAVRGHADPREPLHGLHGETGREGGGRVRMGPGGDSRQRALSHAGFLKAVVRQSHTPLRSYIEQRFRGEIPGLMRGHERNANGVPEQSPGLRSYPGKRVNANSNPVRVAQNMEPLQGSRGRGVCRLPRVASQPWAVIWNRVAVHTKE